MKSIMLVLDYYNFHFYKICTIWKIVWEILLVSGKEVPCELTLAWKIGGQGKDRIQTVAQ